MNGARELGRVGKLLWYMCELRKLSVHFHACKPLCTQTESVRRRQVSDATPSVCDALCTAAHTYILTTDKTLLYEHLRAYCNKAIKLRLWNFYLIWAGLSPYVCTCYFFVIYSWRHHAMPPPFRTPLFVYIRNDFYLGNLSSFLFLFLFRFSFSFNSITKYECIIFPPKFCSPFFHCVTVRVFLFVAAAAVVVVFGWLV